MSKTVVGLFEKIGDAERVVQKLAENGVPRNNISVAVNQNACRAKKKNQIE